MKNSQALRIIIPLLLITLGATARLLPHPPNFAPITAIALFGGLYLPKRWSIIAPLLAMLVSDIFIGFYSWPIMVSVYGSFILVSLIGLWLRPRKTFATVFGGTLLSSIIFFLITNAAVWAFGTMYSHNLNGLLESYLMAIPFFKNSVLGDVFYAGVLVGGMEMLSYVMRRKGVTNQPNLCSFS